MAYASQNEASPSLRAANCETVPTFVGFWGPSEIVSYADQNEASPSLGAANCETAATFVGSWEVQRVGVICRPERRPPRTWGLRAAKLSLVSVAPGRPSSAAQNEAPRRPWGPLTANEASPSFRAANCETVATFVGYWGGQRNGVIRRPE